MNVQLPQCHDSIFTLRGLALVLDAFGFELFLVLNDEFPDTDVVPNDRA